MSTEYLEDAYQALQDSKLEDWFVEFNPPEDKGFMFANEPNLEILNKHLKLYSSHSGSSYGWTMKTLQYELRKQPKHILTVMIQESKKSSNPDIREQGKALEEFKEGKLTYAQMRERCG
jgi:hypothetical protein